MTLVFCVADVVRIKHLGAILTIFEVLTGLHVNRQKKPSLLDQ